MAVIENIIAQVIAREEAERKAAEEAERETNRLQMREEAESQLPATSIISKPGQGNTTTPQTTQPAIGGKQDWYFYNPQLVEQGKAEFQRLWGRRKLEDNWRRKNKTVVALDDFEEIDYSESEDIAPKDSIPNSQENEATESSVSPEKDPKKGTTDSIANDTHRPEYYLAQIPLTEEAMQASNALLSEALYGAGMVFKDRMHDFQRAEAMFERLIRQFPDFAQADEAYYQLFLTELAIEYYEKKVVPLKNIKPNLSPDSPKAVMPRHWLTRISQRMPYMVNNVKIHSMSVLMSISRWATQPLCGLPNIFLPKYIH